jgi:protein-tyrosine phosphatase
VLTATRQQRAHCVTLAPASLRRTFTLRQFARLAGAVGLGCLGDLPPGLRAQTLVRSVIDVRGSMQPVNANEDDVADPVNLPLEGFRECARDINVAVEMMIDIIMPT